MALPRPHEPPREFRCDNPFALPDYLVRITQESCKPYKIDAHPNVSWAQYRYVERSSELVARCEVGGRTFTATGVHCWGGAEMLILQVAHDMVAAGVPDGTLVAWRRYGWWQESRSPLEYGDEWGPISKLAPIYDLPIYSVPSHLSVTDAWKQMNKWCRTSGDAGMRVRYVRYCGRGQERGHRLYHVDLGRDPEVGAFIFVMMMWSNSDQQRTRG